VQHDGRRLDRPELRALVRGRLERRDVVREARRIVGAREVAQAPRRMSASSVG
jgi:hypothetical protein